MGELVRKESYGVMKFLRSLIRRGQEFIEVLVGIMWIPKPKSKLNWEDVYRLLNKVDTTLNGISYDYTLDWFLDHYHATTTTDMDIDSVNKREAFNSLDFTRLRQLLHNQDVLLRKLKGLLLQLEEVIRMEMQTHGTKHTCYKALMTKQ